MDRKKTHEISIVCHYVKLLCFKKLQSVGEINLVHKKGAYLGKEMIQCMLLVLYSVQVQYIGLVYCMYVCM